MTGEVYGRLDPCETCGRPKTEYVDHGTHGVYRCWWCEERTRSIGLVRHGDPDDHDEAPLPIALLTTAWHATALENVDEWGMQAPETLLLAMQEELGELTQAYLEAEYEDGPPERIAAELDDLGALLLQLYMRLTEADDA